MSLIHTSGPFISSYFQSDLFGKFIFIVLFALSIVSWSLLVQKILHVRHVRRLGAELRSRFAKELHHPLNFEVGDSAHPFGELLSTMRKKCIEVLNKNATLAGSEAVYLSSADIEWVDSALFAATNNEGRRLSRHLYLLSIVKGLAPFLGLLGTVWGILLTLAQLQTQSIASSSSAVLGGLAMALGTTVAGLVVAIPALVGHVYLTARLGEVGQEMDQFFSEALGAVELQYRRVH